MWKCGYIRRVDENWEYFVNLLKNGLINFYEGKRFWLYDCQVAEAYCLVGDLFNRNWYQVYEDVLRISGIEEQKLKESEIIEEGERILQKLQNELNKYIQTKLARKIKYIKCNDRKIFTKRIEVVFERNLEGWLGITCYVYIRPH